MKSCLAHPPSPIYANVVKDWQELVCGWVDVPTAWECYITPSVYQRPRANPAGRQLTVSQLTVNSSWSDQILALHLCQKLAHSDWSTGYYCIVGTRSTSISLHSHWHLLTMCMWQIHLIWFWFDLICGNCQNKGNTNIKFLNRALGHHEPPELCGSTCFQNTLYTQFTKCFILFWPLPVFT